MKYIQNDCHPSVPFKIYLDEKVGIKPEVKVTKYIQRNFAILVIFKSVKQ